MLFTFKPLTIEYLKEIDSWDYEGFVEEVLMAPYFDSISKTGKLIGPGGCEGFTALLGKETAGLFEFNTQGSTMEIGLALKPELIGKGLGVNFVKQGIAFGIQYYGNKIERILLVVDSNNDAAISVYEKTGFKRIDQKDNEIEMLLTLA